jgi:hypothetical protein
MIVSLTSFFMLQNFWSYSTDLGSILIPLLIVLEIKILLIYVPLAAAGFSLIHCGDKLLSIAQNLFRGHMLPYRLKCG